MATCPVCCLVAEQNFSIIGDVCKHTFHVDCAGDSIDYDYCPSCVNNKNSSVRHQPIISEPHTTDGIDYVLSPGERKQTSLIRTGISSVVSLVTRKTEPKVEGPIELLKQRVPIETIMKKHKYGLDHMLRDGVHIDDFLSNGYKWDDLVLFEDISKNGPTRSLQTFTNGLSLTASHLKLYPDRLPIDKFKKLTEISSSEFNSLLGLYFTDDGPLCCDGIDYQWNAKDCAKLGLTMPELLSFGLQWIEQYQDLMSGLTEKEQIQAEKALGVKAHHLQSLRSLNQEQEILKQRELDLLKQKRKENMQRTQRVECFQDDEEEEVKPETGEQFEFENEEIEPPHFDAEVEETIYYPVVNNSNTRRRQGVKYQETKIDDLIIPREQQQQQQQKRVEHVPASYRRKTQEQQSKPLIMRK